MSLRCQKWWVIGSVCHPGDITLFLFTKNPFASKSLYGKFASQKTCAKRKTKRFLDLAIKPEFGVYHMVNEGYCNWYDFTKEIFNISGGDAQNQIIPIKSGELKRLARRPICSALTNKKLDDLGLRMRNWKEALNDYLMEEKRGR